MIISSNTCKPFTYQFHLISNNGGHLPHPRLTSKLFRSHVILVLQETSLGAIWHLQQQSQKLWQLMLRC